MTHQTEQSQRIWGK